MQSAPHAGAEAKKNASKTKFHMPRLRSECVGQKPDLGILCIMCNRIMQSAAMVKNVAGDMLCFATPIDDRINEEPASLSTH